MNTDFLLGFASGKAASGGGSSVDVEALSATENKTYTAPSGKAYSPVMVNVPNSYSAADEGKVVSNGALVAQTSDTVTQNGTVDTTLINSLLVNVSGGGGASNLVTGTFTGTTPGAAMDIDLPYTGSGYPIAVIVYPKGGIVGNSDFNSLIQRYAIGAYYIIKRNQSLTPRYSANSTYDLADLLYMYKTNASSATAYSFSGSSNTSSPYNNTNATSSTAQRLLIRSATKMSVFIADTSYGFAANIEYTYYVIYSE